MKKLGIAGCSGHALKFGNLINSFDESEITVVWDYDKERGNKACEELNCPFEEDYDRLLSRYDLDAMIVVVENKYKYEVIMKAVDKGLSIFVEKPLCINYAQALDIQKAVKEKNVRFFMSDPFIRKGLIKIRELLKQNKIGRVTSAHFHMSHASAINYHAAHDMYNFDKHGGGIMLDVGGHALHMVHYLFGCPEALTASLAYCTPRAKENNVEENAMVIFQYPDDVLVHMQASWIDQGSATEIMIYGTEGMAKVAYGKEFFMGNEWVEITDPQRNVTVYDKDLIMPETHVRYFMDMLVKDLPNDIIGRDPFSNSGVGIDEATEYMKIIDKIYESARKGEKVKVNE